MVELKFDVPHRPDFKELGKVNDLGLVLLTKDTDTREVDRVDLLHSDVVDIDGSINLVKKRIH